jgi:hypothetical protein
MIRVCEVELNRLLAEGKELRKLLLISRFDPLEAVELCARHYVSSLRRIAKYPPAGSSLSRSFEVKYAKFTHPWAI